MRTAVTICITIFLITVSCMPSSENENEVIHLVKDAAGRKVYIPDTTTTVTGLRSGALRLLCYMDLTDKVGYIEGNEKRRSVPYLIANPGLRELDIIGTGNNYDTELLAASKTSLIITTYMNKAEADRLQKISGKPVFVLKYGNLSYEIDDFYNSLRLLGKIFNRAERADSLIEYINMNFEDCRNRVARTGKNNITVYIGGVAHSGAHGITSTVPFYTPFRILSVKNAAESIDLMGPTTGFNNENAFIDSEQLITWDPDYLFLDVTGISIWQDEIRNPVISETLSAIRNKNTYTILPYNWYTTNYENLICNTWFIGKTIYPEAFSDINIKQKCNEIYRFFLGSDLYDEMKNLYNPFIRYK